jgi:hypothetical protein
MARPFCLAILALVVLQSALAVPVDPAPSQSGNCQAHFNQPEYAMPVPIPASQNPCPPPASNVQRVLEGSPYNSTHSVGVTSGGPPGEN